MHGKAPLQMQDKKKKTKKQDEAREIMRKRDMLQRPHLTSLRMSSIQAS